MSMVSVVQLAPFHVSTSEAGRARAIAVQKDAEAHETPANPNPLLIVLSLVSIVH